MITKEEITSKIYLVHGKKVMLDFDVAELYAVETKVLNQAVKRNANKFQQDCMFQLTNREWEALRSQFVILKKRSNGNQQLPFAFTVQGVLMLSTVLNSEIAIGVHIYMIRALSKMRELLQSNKETLHQFEKIERNINEHDEDSVHVFEYLKKMSNPPGPTRFKTGYRRRNELE